MDISRQRRVFLLGLTLNELVFILLFLILLVNAVQFDRSTQALAEKSRNVEELDHHVEVLKERVHIAQTALGRFSLVVEDMDDSKLDQLFTDLVMVKDLRAKVEKANIQLLEAQEVLRGFEDVTHGLSKDEIEKAISGLNKQRELRAQIDDLLVRNEAVVGESDLLRQQVTSQRGQIAYVQSRFENKNGLDHPPCWVSVDGSIEYMLKTVLHEGSISVESIWPSYRAEEASKIPGVDKLVGNVFTLDQFAQNAQSILNWSKQQNPECRHFVRIYDSPNTSKHAFKDDLHTVETYFYKHLVR